jgi:hypothetical protein
MAVELPGKGSGVEIRLTSRHVWLSAVLCGGVSFLLLVPLLLVFKDEAFHRSALPVAGSSALFWGVVAVVAILRFWELYYVYFYPRWVRWLVPLDLLLYGAIGLGLWWLALRLPGPVVLSFVLLGGLEGVTEHVVGILVLRILDQVPWLHGLTPLPILIFSFFEYVLYWTLVAWLAWGLAHLLTAG